MDPALCIIPGASRTEPVELWFRAKDMSRSIDEVFPIKYRLRSTDVAVEKSRRFNEYIHPRIQKNKW